MYCNKCGNEINSNQKYCNKCGKYLFYENPNNINDNRNTIIIIILLIVAVIVGGIVIYLIKLDNKSNYYINDETIGENEQTEIVQSNTNSTVTTTGKYKTAIITDNIYTGISVEDI